MIALVDGGTRMAKKQRASGVESPKGRTDDKSGMNPAFLRFGEHTLADLQDNVQQLHNFADQLSALIKNASDLGATSIRVDGTTKLDRGFVLIRDFLRGVDMAIVKRKHSRD